MSCVDAAPTFRLLDAYVGWDRARDTNLVGFDDPAGLRLARISGGVDPAGFLPYLPPPRLAFGGRPATAWLVTDERSPRLLRRDPCAPADCWPPVWRPACDPGLLAAPVAVAVRGRRLAVADRGVDGDGRVWLLGESGGRLLAEIRVARPVAVALAPWGEILVAVEGEAGVLRFGPSGDPRGAIPPPMGAGTAERLAAGGGSIWLVTRRKDGVFDLWRAKRKTATWKPATIAKLAKSLPRTPLVAVSATGFCLADRGPGAVPVVRCFDFAGCPIAEGEVEPPQPPERQREGELATLAIDSGIPRCRWHRARIDADLPPGTSIEILATSSEEADADPSTAHSDDAQTEVGAVDFLFRQPPGRFLFLRLRLRGDGRATPVVRRIRLDFPRVTSLELLPAVYREDPRAEDFTERFLSLFDAAIEDLDALIARFPALLDAAGVDERVLPWLGGILDVAFEPSWPAARRRALLAAVPRLYRLRGTPEGIALAVELVFGVRPAIQELFFARRFGAVGGGSRLGAVRLFGLARSRFRLGRSALGIAPLVGFGAPADDPLRQGAYRFRVLMPPGAAATAEARARLARLIESQKPAHTLASVRFGGHGFVLGGDLAVGVDTAFSPLPAPVLGRSGNVRLGRASVLSAGLRGPRGGFAVGAAAVGIQTFME
ncbi:MAG TPA: phage tail protein [Thermoanaerobaculia bacterium]|nr:phage tail protein [Thermoanaerobaculia bacterium]